MLSRTAFRENDVPPLHETSDPAELPRVASLARCATSLTVGIEPECKVLKRTSS